jgi:cyclohexyl-isocyanide hydratase
MNDYGCKIVDKRVVCDENVITAGGVTAGLDLGLYLCAILYNTDIMYKIANQMEYQLPENFEELF